MPYLTYISFSVCENSVELLFAISGGHMSIKMNFIKSIMDTFIIGKNNTRVLILAVGLINDTVVPLDLFDRPESLQSIIENNNGSLPSIEQLLRHDMVKVG